MCERGAVCFLAACQPGLQLTQAPLTQTIPSSPEDQETTFFLLKCGGNYWQIKIFQDSSKFFAACIELAHSFKLTFPTTDLSKSGTDETPWLD